MTLSLTAPLYSETVVFYNVENLFQPNNDGWTKSRYYNKLNQIARVITCIDNHYPELVGLAEVENERCLIDLCRKMPKARYKYIHFDSPDRRGIDVALIYDSLMFKPAAAKAINVYLDSTTTTRDILYVNNERLHIFVCHLPSQLGGAAATEWKRERAKSILRHYTDSILKSNSTANIIVMGDMNSAPNNDLQPMVAITYNMSKEKGTHKYQGVWTMLDQFYLSPNLKNYEFNIFSPAWLLEEDKKYLGQRPIRTFNGLRYNKNGFSDHLPIVLKIE